tara:strand:+ start:5165 stop:5716 length:552 start_codon:yes stop_codon:yes gene_type:complete
MLNKEVSNIIQERKSIYPNEFNGKKISDNIILELLNNANFAPTHKMTQPWFFKVYSDNSKLDLLKEIFIVNDMTDDRKKNLENNFDKSSHIICICVKLNKEILPEWEEIAATSMAVQNLWISCVDSKIGGYWSTPKYISKLSNFLNLKKTEKCLGFFYLGCYDVLNPRNKKRIDINNKIEWYK